MERDAKVPPHIVISFLVKIAYNVRPNTIAKVNTEQIRTLKGSYSIAIYAIKYEKHNVNINNII